MPLAALAVAEHITPAVAEIKRVVELYAQAFTYHCNNYPHRWFEDMAGKQLAAAATALRPEVAAAAKTTTALCLILRSLGAPAQEPTSKRRREKSGNNGRQLLLSNFMPGLRRTPCESPH